MTTANNEAAVADAAKALGEALKSDSRFTDWRELGQAVDNNDALKQTLTRFGQLAQKAQMAMQGGPQLDEAEVAEIQKVQNDLKDDVLFNRHNAATGALLEMLHGVNMTLSNELGIDFAANVAASSQQGGGQQ
jgi:cell fate (sporulation/competence/biofilm development) regulator YlbF (YheA/YmcA/DUF963 family)